MVYYKKDTTVIAVYGTLRKGAYNYKFLKKVNPKFIGKGKDKINILILTKMA